MVVSESFHDEVPSPAAPPPFEHAAMSEELDRIRDSLDRMSRERAAVMRDLARAREAAQDRQDAREP